MRCPHCGFENPDQFSFCGQCGQELTQPTKSSQLYSIAGERRLVTVLFTHVPDLPALSERLDLDDARTLLNACLESLFEAIYRYGGTIDKFVGQEIMAIFGAPQVHEDDAERAIRAAIDMAQALDQFNSDYKSCLPWQLEMCAGINTGLVFAGQVGAAGQEAYSVMGDAVNLANRLAYLCEPGQVLVGEPTYSQVAGRFTFRPLPAIRVRGKLEQVPIYLLLAERKGTTRGWRMSHLVSPLVGRSEEMERLARRVEQLHRNRGGIVLLTGEAGLGKSRLVAELRAATPDVRWLEGRSQSYSANWPLAPFRDLFRRWAGVGERSTSEIRQWARNSLPGSSSDTAPFILHLMDVQPDAEAAETLVALSADAVYNRTLAAVRSFLADAAAAQPTVVVMEDFHWADRSSLELLRRLIPMTLDLPLLFLLVSRPDPRPAIDPALYREQVDADAIDEVSLTPLSQGDTRSLVSNLLRGVSVPPELSTRVLEVTEGNPLFVEEIIRMLIQEGVLVERDGDWILLWSLDKIEIPNTLRGLLNSRIDRLSPEVRDTLGQAAVIGRVFTSRLLTETGWERATLDEHLRILLETDFIRYYAMEGEEGRAYIFNHGLTREAAYESILLARREDLHRRVLEAIERLYAGHLDDQYGALAHHARAGKVWDKATHYLHAAGDRAKATGALPEATRYYREAMMVLEEHAVDLDHERLADLYHECASAHTMLGEYDAARRTWQRLLDLGETLDDALLRGHAFHSAAVVDTHLGDTVSAIEHARRACEQFQSADADWPRGVALLTLAQDQLKSGQMDAAQASIDEGLELVGKARRWPGYDPRGEAAYYAAMIDLLKGDLDHALRSFEWTRELAGQAGEQGFVSLSWAFGGLAQAMRGMYDMGNEMAVQGIDVGQESELPLVSLACAACAAWVHVMAGRCGPALRLTEFVNDEAYVDFKDAQAIAFSARGDAYVILGQYQSALETFQRAFEVAGLTHVVTIPVLRGIGAVYLRLGQLEPALISLENAVNMASSQGMKWFHAQGLQGLAWAYQQLGDHDRAAAAADALLVLAGPAGYREMVGWAYLLRGLATRNPSDVRHGLEVGQALGNQLLLWEAGTALIDDEPQAASIVATAVRVIADGLPADLQRVFLDQERVRAIWSGSLTTPSGTG